MAAKLKDGLFLGDYEAAQDLEFIVANKITHIINCSGREIPNGWERSGIRYLTYFWPENGNCIIFDESNAVLDEIYTFIETTIDVAESVLVHSIDGVSRACFCSAVYFMLKYRWTMEKTLAYLQSKRPDLMPRPGFMRHLAALDQSLKRVTHAAGVSPNTLKRYTTWDVSVLSTCACVACFPCVSGCLCACAWVRVFPCHRRRDSV